MRLEGLGLLDERTELVVVSSHSLERTFSLYGNQKLQLFSQYLPIATLETSRHIWEHSEMEFRS